MLAASCLLSFVFKVYDFLRIIDPRVAQRDQLIVSVDLNIILAHQVFQSRWSLLILNRLLLRNNAFLEEVVVWEVLILQFAQPDDVIVRDKAFNLTLLDIFHFSWLTEALFDLDYVHDVVDYGLVASRELLSNFGLNLSSFIVRLLNGLDVVDFLVPYFLIFRYLVELSNLECSHLLELLQPERIQIEQLFKECFHFDRIHKRPLFTNVTVRACYAKQVTLFSDDSRIFLQALVLSSAQNLAEFLSFLDQCGNSGARLSFNRYNLLFSNVLLLLASVPKHLNLSSEHDINLSRQFSMSQDRLRRLKLFDDKLLEHLLLLLLCTALKPYLWREN